MGSRNSFKDLEEENIRAYGPPPNNISKNVKSNIRAFRLVGDIIDLFFPKIIKIFVNLVGGAEKEETPAKKDTLPPNLTDDNNP